MANDYINTLLAQGGRASLSPDDVEVTRAIPACKNYEAFENAPVLPRTIAMLKASPVTKTYTIRRTLRDWDDLSNLKPRVVRKLLEALKDRCTTARDAIDDSLVTLEISTHIFISEHDPFEPAAGFPKYTKALNKAKLAGRALFPPQTDYRDAIMALSMLVTDLVDLFPKDHADKERISRELNQGKLKAQQDEEMVQKALHPDNTGLKPMTYVATARMRFDNWSKEEEKLKAWAEECMDAME
ncbi:hypothetical protein HBI56_003430 [Parastagonospora nodorum]|nr:hypothetical protein HBH53_092740 [Parastagonospora nodorum]KAH4123952.1 hypothetical protein HBH47_070010 [Parastagonospora nodorum]KAH4352322.1 hypothetical protein HBH98_019550 [Parastagonospora nodorum]KAH4381535.1 hypothetical protein HBH97_086650 [Parastagonospora nodorum]KAH4425938.1 hypothetical protein HBH99_029710 [Parastagonospora nodorum]